MGTAAMPPSPARRCEEEPIANIREIARLSGVSVATVSRVLNDSANVSEEVRERVLGHARRLDYVPSAAARTLVGGRSQLIGVVVNTGAGHPDLKHPFFQDVLVALKDELGEHDYDLLLASKRSFLRSALEHRVDGLVLMGVDRNAEDLETVLARRIPTVFVDLQLRGERAGYVTSDNVMGGRLAVEHLAALGHTRIATITGLAHTTPGGDRLSGYRDGLRVHGLPERPEYVCEGDFYPDSGSVQMQALLALPEPPTAVFAASDDMAMGALSAIAQASLSVPGDVSLVGFDDDEVAPLLRPPLSTVRQNKPALGAAAGAALIRLIESEDATPPELVLPVELVVRESSAAPATL
jgi:LacI family transcriptional regulator